GSPLARSPDAAVRHRKETSGCPNAPAPDCNLLETIQRTGFVAVFPDRAGGPEGPGSRLASDGGLEPRHEYVQRSDRLGRGNHHDSAQAIGEHAHLVAHDARELIAERCPALGGYAAEPAQRDAPGAEGHE